MENKQALKINTLETMMKENAKEHRELKKDIKEISLKLDITLEKMEKKFAPMWVKNVIVWVGGTIGSFLLLYVLVQLFK